MKYYNEIKYLLRCIHEIHASHYMGINDPRINYYKDLIELILKGNVENTILFFEQIVSNEDMENISSSFEGIMYEFQSKELLDTLEIRVQKCKESKYYNFILTNFENAKKTMLLEKVSDWERYTNRIYTLDVIDLIDYLKTESDEKVLASIYGYMDVLTRKHLSLKLIDYMDERLKDITDEQEKKWMTGMLNDSREILKKYSY